MAHGSTVDTCDNRLKQCNADCAKDLKACQAKANVKPTPVKPTPKK